jgi:putative FmdB family regulatory protein
MPLYDWKCQACDAQVEILRPMNQALESVHCACGGTMTQQLSAAHVSPDIAPYRAVAGDRAGEYITSRREHREFLKRNRFTEVGNEPVRPIKNDFRPKRGEIAAELKRVIPEVLKR